MTMIELTRTKAQGGTPIWINVDSIDYLSQVNVASNRPEHVATLVHFRSGKSEYVVETPEQVISLLSPVHVPVVDDQMPTAAELVDGVSR